VRTNKFRSVEELDAKTVPPASWPPLCAALAIATFNFLQRGQLISLIGTWMQTVAQSWLMYKLTGPL